MFLIQALRLGIGLGDADLLREGRWVRIEFLAELLHAPQRMISISLSVNQSECVNQMQM
jgi:hypothetical protein